MFFLFLGCESIYCINEDLDRNIVKVQTHRHMKVVKWEVNSLPVRNALHRKATILVPSILTRVVADRNPWVIHNIIHKIRKEIKAVSMFCTFLSLTLLATKSVCNRWWAVIISNHWKKKARMRKIQCQSRVLIVKVSKVLKDN